ncbi:MAG: hypothetical protein BGO01_15380 [Armatimonadetes bacterium 55-13]|nr:hypothetical protein [Armatimonadota bacterium]OJU65246.1 MAG: hypothetical protein BGO01_15380 [Armatimonadetes bacterium 55-13]
MERSWDYVVKSPTGIALTIGATILLILFIIAGGIFMRLEMMRQRDRAEAARANQTEPKA